MSPPARSRSGDILSDLVLATFRLNGLFLEAAEGMARPVGLTAAWWQVLGAVLETPASVAAIARKMGLARQSVQRVADLLVARNLAHYRTNPQHKRAQLLDPTAEGHQAIAALSAAQHRWADRVSSSVDEAALCGALQTIQQLIDTLDQGSPL